MDGGGGLFARIEGHNPPPLPSPWNYLAKGIVIVDDSTNPAPLIHTSITSTKGGGDFTPGGGEVFWAKQRPRRSLVGMCLSNLGLHLEDLLDDLPAIAHFLPSSVKLTLLAIARRRGLLSDDLLFALVDESWEILDVSGCDVTDCGLEYVAMRCPLLKAVDISRCSGLTSEAVRALVQHCRQLCTLRCGGTPLSNATAKESLDYLLPKLNVNQEADSWEDLDTEQVGRGAQELRWLVWPSIDDESSERLHMECPIVVANPAAMSRSNTKPLWVPREALPNVALDDPFVSDVDPTTWAMKAVAGPPRCIPATLTQGLSIAERFKLAFLERDERMASKRAKNVRQNQRRAQKAWLSSDSSAKAQLLANKALKSIKKS